MQESQQACDLQGMTHMTWSTKHLLLSACMLGSVHQLQWHKILLLQAICCLGQLSATSCSACGRFLGPSGPRKTSLDSLTACLGHMSGKLVSAASDRLALGSCCPHQQGSLVQAGTSLRHNAVATLLTLHAWCIALCLSAAWVLCRHSIC